MTNKAAPKQPKGGADLARFLQDWTSMWREELRAQTSDPEAMAGAMEMWRAAMAVWSSVPPFLAMIPPGAPIGAPAGVATPARRRGNERAGTPRAEAADVASLAVDAEVERLNRRVDELESRLAKLERPRRRSSPLPPAGRSPRRDTG